MLILKALWFIGDNRCGKCFENKGLIYKHRIFPDVQKRARVRTPTWCKTLQTNFKNFNFCLQRRVSWMFSETCIAMEPSVGFSLVVRKGACPPSLPVALHAFCLLSKSSLASSPHPTSCFQTFISSWVHMRQGMMMPCQRESSKYILPVL